MKIKLSGFQVFQLLAVIVLPMIPIYGWYYYFPAVAPEKDTANWLVRLMSEVSPSSLGMILLLVTVISGLLELSLLWLLVWLPFRKRSIARSLDGRLSVGLRNISRCRSVPPLVKGYSEKLGVSFTLIEAKIPEEIMRSGNTAAVCDLIVAWLCLIYLEIPKGYGVVNVFHSIADTMHKHWAPEVIDQAVIYIKGMDVFIGEDLSLAVKERRIHYEMERLNQELAMIRAAKVNPVNQVETAVGRACIRVEQRTIKDFFSRLFPKSSRVENEA